MIKGSFHDATYKKRADSLLYVHTKLFTKTIFCFKRGRDQNTEIGPKSTPKSNFFVKLISNVKYLKNYSTETFKILVERSSYIKLKIDSLKNSNF